MSKITSTHRFKSYLREYLNIFWLRPENAVWRTYDAAVLSGLDWTLRPSVDLCCADGVNSFILCGGKLGIAFDAFLSIRDMSVADFFSGKKDIYDYPFIRKEKIKIACKPKRVFDYGIDWKRNSLQKAAKLCLYKNLIFQDANDRLSLKDASVRLVFSNSIYWMRDVKFVMRELRRVLADNGKVIALMPSASFKKYYIYNKYLRHGWKFCKVLDMGRYRHVNNCYTYDEWKKIFNDCGFSIRSHTSYLSGRFVEMNVIGFRPMSKVLIKMANSLSRQERADIKTEWIDTLMHILMPMFEDGFLSDDGGEQTFFMFELAKR